MKILLERDDFLFTTLSGHMGRHRVLLVKINGKEFVVHRTVDAYREMYSEDFAKHMDELLVSIMERMLTKIFNDACAAVPEGVDLLEEP